MKNYLLKKTTYKINSFLNEYNINLIDLKKKNYIEWIRSLDIKSGFNVTSGPISVIEM